MYRPGPLLALTIVLAINGCGRHDGADQPPDTAAPPAGEAATEAMEKPTTPPPAKNETNAPLCSPEWFTWVNQQVLAMHNGDLAKLYPGGLAEVGSDEWFLAIDKLTGGDGAHGPDGGSTEWCNMIQQRLSQPGSNALPNE